MIEAIYLIIAIIPALLATLGSGIGQGLIGKKALQEMINQPASSNGIAKLCIIASALTETASVIVVVLSLLFITDSSLIENYEYALYGVIGTAFAIGISGLFAGITAAMPAIAACSSLARQPFLDTKILNIMLITQTLILTPNMFGMLVALLIKAKIVTATSWPHAMQLLCSGMAIGLASIGPSIGLSWFAFQACSAVGFNKQMYGKILTFTFICEAMIEAPVIFALLIAFMILNSTVHSDSILQGYQFLAAALCIGLSTMAPGINSGRTSGTACAQIAQYPLQYSNISKITMLTLTMIDSFAIYGLIMAIIILFF